MEGKGWSLGAVEEHPEVADAVGRALREDIGAGDASSLAVIDEKECCRGRIVSRGDAVVCGVTVAARVFREVDHRIQVAVEVPDGGRVARGDVVLAVAGPARGILTAERTALNFLQRMSGIATHTRQYVDRVEGAGAVILDTRKTTPTLRVLEKYAVACGGGVNHRMGLYDRILLKDNHLVRWRKYHQGDLADMVRAARQRFPELMVEVEVENEEDFQRVWEARPEWILLDNMSPEQMRRCVVLNTGRCRLEASGGITLETVADVAATGVDAISVGALTHASPWCDLSLEFDADA
jgi:nicotinate-nucleotide pyrophosphorylase (carboxylating)